MTKGSFRKYIIIPMGANNVERVMMQSNIHIANINNEISTNFICSNNKKFVVITNKIAIFSNLNIMEKYIKELNDIDLNNIMSLRCYDACEN